MQDLYKRLNINPNKSTLKEVETSLLQHNRIIQFVRLWLHREKDLVDFYSAATGKLNTHDHHYLSSYIVYKNKLQKTHPQNKTK